MGVGVDDGDDRSLAKFFINEVQRRLGGFCRCQHIEYDPAGVAFNERDVGEVEAAHLIDSVWHYFIKPIGHVEDGLPLQ